MFFSNISRIEMFRTYVSRLGMYCDLIIIKFVSAYAHEMYYKDYTKMTNNKFHFNKHTQYTCKCDWPIAT